MKKILSIVIPSYNVEKYLEQTLTSFVETSILGDIEVLVVDDGSKDSTAEIGKRFEEQYPETFRVISKENGGHGSTINKGIEECTGKYFKVVDGDDWVNTSGFKILVEKLKSCDADYIVTNYYEVDDQTGEKTGRDYAQLKKEGMEESRWNFNDVAKRAQPAMHALVFRSSILKENQIRLDEHSFYVDVEYVLYPLPYVESVVYFDLYVYMYRLALVTQSVSIQGFRKHIQNHIDVILHLAEFAEKYKNSATEEKQVKVDFIGKRIAQMVGDQITIFMSYPTGDKENKAKFLRFDKDLKEKSEWIYNLSSYESGTLRILRKMNFNGYKLIMGAGQKRNGMEG
ncbi:glycosyltransferase family 2 protein [Faecalicatena contorta]|uniref:Glycosyltransferase involved in cell wall bisynthesis n=1 Tax=Faecalicatena contorta TaxID=39482 RepID=A0A315ZSD4_9FIRM|nr:glycosyltransferase family 2 protein [Faecalicatena contorta]PWJ48212.1 glycosyltransferase involved in cell wall biosynthesis [Faecalicatena contorta]SUQ15488.1 Glycosyltransferase involved in cell wall bisynthesis [Faecalicatena contorta]